MGNRLYIMVLNVDLLCIAYWRDGFILSSHRIWIETVNYAETECALASKSRICKKKKYFIADMQLIILGWLVMDYY